jgi:hypothetical protein
VRGAGPGGVDVFVLRGYIGVYEREIFRDSGI